MNSDDMVEVRRGIADSMREIDKQHGSGMLMKYIKFNEAMELTVESVENITDPAVFRLILLMSHQSYVAGMNDAIGFLKEKMGKSIHQAYEKGVNDAAKGFVENAEGGVDSNADKQQE